jgi:hypothetical protein
MHYEVPEPMVATRQQRAFQTFQVHRPHWLFEQYSSSKLVHEYLCQSLVCASEPWVLMFSVEFV